MKPLAAIKNVFVLLVVVLLNSLTFAGHSAAMNTMSHDMGGMKHASSDATSCATLCRTAVVNKEDTAIRNDENEDDDEPTLPFYAQNQQLHQDGKSITQSLYAAEIKLPPKIPIYILYGVFRA